MNERSDLSIAIEATTSLAHGGPNVDNAWKALESTFGILRWVQKGEIYLRFLLWKLVEEIFWKLSFVNKIHK